MTTSVDSLNFAWYMYPEPKGKHYSKSDLIKPSTVEEIFDYCQILLAVISKEGWQFLLSHYSFDQLAEIDKSSGWFQPCSESEFRELIEYEALISGYNPKTDEFGIYNEENGSFTKES